MATKKKTAGNLRTKFMEYWHTHPNYTAFVHTTLGIGLGLLGQTFIKDGYVDAVGWTLVLLGVIGHMYPLVG